MIDIADVVGSDNPLEKLFLRKILGISAYEIMFLAFSNK